MESTKLSPVRWEEANGFVHVFVAKESWDYELDMDYEEDVDYHISVQYRLEPKEFFSVYRNKKDAVVFKQTDTGNRKDQIAIWKNLWAEQDTEEKIMDMFAKKIPAISIPVESVSVMDDEKFICCFCERKIEGTKFVALSDPIKNKGFCLDCCVWSKFC